MTSNACKSVCLKELFGGGSQKSETQIHFSAALAHLVERHLAKVEVASSSLVSRSILKNRQRNRVGGFLLYRSKARCVACGCASMV